MITPGTVREILDTDALYKLPQAGLRVEGDLRLSGDVEQTGDLQISGDLRFPQGFWVDIDFPLIIRTTGANRPVLTALRGNIEAPLWIVDDVLNIEGQEVIHGYQEGTPIQWHLHLITFGTNVDARYVKFEVEWCWTNSNGVLTDAIVTTSPELLIPADTPARTMIVRQIAIVEMPTLEIGAHIYARLKRVAATGTAPTGDIFCSMLQLHVLCDSVGTVAMTTK